MKLLPTLGLFQLLILGSLLLQPARAENLTWSGTRGDWNDSANWSSGILPAFADTVTIDNSGTATLPVGVSGTYGGDFLSNGLILGNTSGGSGAIAITGGVLSGTTVFAYLGYAVGSTGKVTVTSGTWSNLASVSVGYSGAGSLLVNGGRVFSGGTIKVGEGSTSNGSVTVTSGTLSGSLVVGGSGTGSLLINGGYVSSGNTTIASPVGSHGSATIFSGSWDATNLTVGDQGTGDLLVHGGHVFSKNESYIGRGSFGHGNVAVTGEGSTWTITGSLTVGLNGSNSTLTIEDGGLVKVGDTSGESITFSTNGGTNNHLRIDDGYIALFGDQRLYVGNLITGGYIQLWNGSTWETAGEGEVQITYYAADAEGEAAAESATGYSGLGGYTVATALAVPEPGTVALILLGISTVLIRRPTQRQRQANSEI